MLRITPIYGSSLSSSSPSFSVDGANNTADDSAAAAATSAADGSNDNDATSTNNDEEDNPPEWLSSQVPTCTLVEYAGVRLLLNTGWDETLPLLPSSTSSEGKNSRNNSLPPNELPDNIDAILVCDSTLSSLGGLPLYFGASKSKTSRGNRAPRSLMSLQQHLTPTATTVVTKNEGAPTSSHHNNPPFFATYPTLKMGQMTMYDHHASLSLDGHNPGYSLEDVDAVFSTDSFTTLKYSQTVYLPMIAGDNSKEGATTVAEGNVGLDNKPHTVTTPLLAITPHLSGHVVGGCYWILRRLSDDATVVLAPTYHHAKEKHLAGSTLHTFGINADALVTMPGGPRGLLGKLYLPPPPASSSSLPPTSSATTTAVAAGKEQNDYHKLIKYNTNKKPILSPPMGNRSESELIESVMAALRRDGNVLLPVDASGRVLELLLILDKHWEKQRLSGAYNLIWVSPMSPNTIEYARSQLEWMAPPLGAQFDSQRGHPYALKHVSICSSISEMEYVIRNSNGNPTAVLASGASMDHGPARDLLLKWGGKPDNLILITDSTRCVPRGDVWFHRHLRGSGGAGEENKVMTQSNDSVGATGLVAEEAVDVTASTAADTDDKEVNEQQASLVGPALKPDSVSAYTTASQILYQWCAAKASGTEMPDEIIVDVHVPHRAPLKGAELQAFLAEEERELRSRQAEMEEKAMMKEIELARGRLRLGVGEGDEATVTTGTVTSDTSGGVQSTVVGPSKVSSTSGKTTASAGGGGLSSSSTRPKKKSRFDQKLFIKFSKPVHSEFQYVCMFSRRSLPFLHTQCVGLNHRTSSSQ